MKTARARMIFDCLRRAALSESAGLSDGQLLQRYFAHRDEAAFAALVRRHGSMVLAVCRRLLPLEDAEDAFQAAFLVLARKGRRIAGQQTIGGWLHGVAYRVALDVRRRGARRRAKEQQVEDMPHPLVTTEEDRSELLALLDRELNRLPDKYRVPVVLCELEGRSRKEAARQLGLAEGTLSSRLATARKKLARRMAGRGLTGASLTALLSSEVGTAVVPGPLVASTVRAAGGVASAGVVALAEGVLKAMLLTKIKGAALVLLLASAVGVGTVGLTYRTAAAADATPTANAPRTTAKTANPDKDDLEALRLEVEALRASLQATRQRVRALEEKEQGRKAAEPNQTTNAVNPQAEKLGDVLIFKYAAANLNPSFPEFVLPAKPETPGEPATAVPPRPAPAAPTPTAVLPRLAPPSPTSGGRTTPRAETKTEADDIQAATAQLMNDPTNKRAQEVVKRALEQMNSPEARVREAAAILHREPMNKRALDELREALEQLNRPAWHP